MKEFIVKCFRWYEQRNKNGNNFQKKTHKWTFNNFSSFFLPPWNLLCYNSLQIFLFWGSSHSQFDCDAGSYNIIYQVIKYFSYVKYFSHCHFSVMAKLPPTSYLRLVDIWLITTQLVPFLLVALTTSIAIFEDDVEINHHGFAR